MPGIVAFTAQERTDPILDPIGVIFDPSAHSIESVADQLQWTPQRDAWFPLEREFARQKILGKSYLVVDHNQASTQSGFCWTGTTSGTEKHRLQFTIEMVTELLSSTPSKQISKIQILRSRCAAVDLLDAASTIATGSARTMVGSIISEMADAWDAWRYLSTGVFGDYVLSYINDILDTPETFPGEKSQVLIELAKNSSEEVRETLIDEISEHCASQAYPQLLQILLAEDNSQGVESENS